MKIAHTNNGNLCIVIPFVLIFNVVTMKLIAPNNDEIDVKCKAKIAKSTLGPECDWIDDKGGYLKKYVLLIYNLLLTVPAPERGPGTY